MAPWYDLEMNDDVIIQHTYPCDASWPGPSWQCMSLDRYTQSTLNVARHAKKSEVEGKIETQIEYQEVQEG